jgi:hypothetical protein
MRFEDGLEEAGGETFWVAFGISLSTRHFEEVILTRPFEDAIDEGLGKMFLDEALRRGSLKRAFKEAF